MKIELPKDLVMVRYKDQAIWVRSAMADAFKLDMVQILYRRQIPYHMIRHLWPDFVSGSRDLYSKTLIRDFENWSITFKFCSWELG